MTTYKVNVTTQDGVKTFTLSGDSITQVTQTVATNYAGTSYTIEQLPKENGLTPDSMPKLINASIGLMLCIIALAIADFKIRKWLNS